MAMVLKNIMEWSKGKKRACCRRRRRCCVKDSKGDEGKKRQKSES